MKQALWHLQRQSESPEERITLSDVGEAVAQMVGRDSPFTAGTVSGWLESRSEPQLDVFLAFAHLTGTSASWLAFNEGVMLAGHHPPPKTMPPGTRVEVAKRRLK
jgi:hypothetical protein